MLWKPRFKALQHGLWDWRWIMYLLLSLTFFLFNYLTYLFDYLSCLLLITYYTSLTLTYALIGSPWLNHVQLQNINNAKYKCKIIAKYKYAACLKNRLRRTSDLSSSFFPVCRSPDKMSPSRALWGKVSPTQPRLTGTQASLNWPHPGLQNVQRCNSFTPVWFLSPSSNPFQRNHNHPSSWQTSGCRYTWQGCIH